MKITSAKRYMPPVATYSKVRKLHSTLIIREAESPHEKRVVESSPTSQQVCCVSACEVPLAGRMPVTMTGSPPTWVSGGLTEVIWTKAAAAAFCFLEEDGGLSGFARGSWRGDGPAFMLFGGVKLEHLNLAIYLATHKHQTCDVTRLTRIT